MQFAMLFIVAALALAFMAGLIVGVSRSKGIAEQQRPLPLENQRF